jgi:hypothetical protein
VTSSVPFVPKTTAAETMNKFVVFVMLDPALSAVVDVLSERQEQVVVQRAQQVIYEYHV